MHRHVANIKGACLVCGERMFWPLLTDAELLAARNYDESDPPRDSRGRFISRLQ